MRRLRDFQIAVLDVCGEDLTCRVVAVDGDQAVLEPRAADAAAALVLPGAATLAFDTAHHPVLLAGAAGAGPVGGTLRFWVTDAVGIPPVRLRPRLRAELAVRVTPIAEDGRRIAFGQDHATTDVSAGGLAIAGLEAQPGTPLRVELVVPGMVRIVTGRARAVRRLAGGATAVASKASSPSSRPRSTSSSSPCAGASPARRSRCATPPERAQVSPLPAVAATISAMTSRRSWLAS